MRISLSPRLSGFETSPTLAINEKVNALWAAGEVVYHLGFGESRFPVHPILASALAANAHHTSYLPSQGLPALREAVAGFYQRHFGLDAAPDRVLVGPGSKPLIYALIQALDGDLVLPTPSWVSYQPHALMAGKRVFWAPASPADGYEFDLEALDTTLRAARAAGGSPRLIVFNSPSNPTSRMLAPALAAEIADYCRRQGLFVIADEIYALTAHGHVPHHSLARDYPEGTAVLGGLSKHLSLGGWRLGVAVLPAGPDGKALLAAARTVAAEVWSSPSAPVQYAALAAYSGDQAIEDYIYTCTRLHALRTQYLWQGLTAMGVSCPRPDGAFYVFANFDRWRPALAGRGITNSPELANHLLDAYQLATLPGSAFGAPSHDLTLRLSSSYLDMETEAKARRLLAAYRSDLSPGELLRDHHPATNAALDRFRRFLVGFGPSTSP